MHLKPVYRSSLQPVHSVMVLPVDHYTSLAPATCSCPTRQMTASNPSAHLFLSCFNATCCLPVYVHATFLNVAPPNTHMHLSCTQHRLYGSQWRRRHRRNGICHGECNHAMRLLAPDRVHPFSEGLHSADHTVNCTGVQCLPTASATALREGNESFGPLHFCACTAASVA